MKDKYIPVITLALTILFSGYGYCSGYCPYSPDTYHPSYSSTVCNLKFYDCNIFNEKILDYEKQLKPFFEKVKSKNILSDSEVEIATKIVNEYYTYLIKNNIVYGKLARDIVNNQGAFARLANIHLEHRAKVEGKSDEMKNVANNIRIALAYSDAKLRSECTEYLPYEAIAKYHYEVFAFQGLSKYAWGGTLLEEFAGSGSWMNVGGYDMNIDFKLIDLTNALIFNKEINGIRARKALSSVVHMPLQHLGDSLLAAVYRILIEFLPS